MPVGLATAEVEYWVAAFCNGKNRCAELMAPPDWMERNVRPVARRSFRYGGRRTIAQRAIKITSTTYVKAFLRLPVTTTVAARDTQMVDFPYEKANRANQR